MPIGNPPATNLVELQQGLADCSGASIFDHTFQSLGRQYFLSEDFSNDLAQWVLDSCNRPALAERMASLDIRDYVSLADLRSDWSRVIQKFRDANPGIDSKSAFEILYSCETAEERVPLGPSKSFATAADPEIPALPVDRPAFGEEPRD